MSDEITVEEMVNHLIRLNRLAGFEERCPTCEAIREALIERDKLFEEVHELKLELVGFKRVKPRVSLKKIKDYMRENYVPQTSEEFAKILTELNIEVSDE